MCVTIFEHQSEGIPAVFCDKEAGSRRAVGKARGTRFTVLVQSSKGSSTFRSLYVGPHYIYIFMMRPLSDYCVGADGRADGFVYPATVALGFWSKVFGSPQPVYY